MNKALQSQATRLSVPRDPRAIPAPTKRAGRSPLGSTEAFVLSRIDGRRTLTDVAALVALSVAEVASIVDRLVELGTVELHEPAASPPEEHVDIDEGDLISIPPPAPPPRPKR